ncbi:hypothetical protein BDP81DRAFT_447333 [Colletotrichum phormii]|uniref:Methyltransferase domain-containing protein n=1 Tax=Colletotrichum phormii TaxID=359342 RepID=A0AAI9ZXH9_9PEZI|nr:uncharacterized protein BDP81DRAFT_447333 [Colletotrichum phormii]KAK1639696.1 hypothetical protein BDP81DRAFT_447333 [Colletotrichum phormii]
MGDFHNIDNKQSIVDSLVTLRSSILDYRRENGRTYQKYYLPNDEILDAQANNPTQISPTFYGYLHGTEIYATAPKLRVPGEFWMLELGRASGPLIMRTLTLKQSFIDEACQVIGVDLSPIQPALSMVGSFKSWSDTIKQAYDNLEPGGYLEIQDNEFPIFCDDGSMPADPKVLKWTQLVIEATNIVGKSMTVAPTFKQLLEDAGFEDVQGRQEKWPISPWQQNNSKQRELGNCCRAGTMEEGLEPICMALFTRGFGWTQDEVVAFCAGVREELTQQTVHGYFNAYYDITTGGKNH